MPKEKYDPPDPRRCYTIMPADEAANGKKSYWAELEISGQCNQLPPPLRRNTNCMRNQDVIYSASGDGRSRHLSSFFLRVLHAGRVRSLSSSLWTLTHLTALHINDNNLTRIPPDIAKLPNLVYLNLSSNKLRSLPSELGHMVSLRWDAEISQLPSGCSLAVNTESDKQMCKDQNLTDGGDVAAEIHAAQVWKVSTLSPKKTFFIITHICFLIGRFVPSAGEYKQGVNKPLFVWSCLQMIWDFFFSFLLFLLLQIDWIVWGCASLENTFSHINDRSFFFIEYNILYKHLCSIVGLPSFKHSLSQIKIIKSKIKVLANPKTVKINPRWWFKNTQKRQFLNIIWTFRKHFNPKHFVKGTTERHVTGEAGGWMKIRTGNSVLMKAECWWKCFVCCRELLLNNNLLRVLPYELGRLFQLQTLGLKGEASLIRPINDSFVRLILRLFVVNKLWNMSLRPVLKRIFENWF